MNALGLRERWNGPDTGPASITLVVLPLKNLSGDSGQDYYADGISEALITELGKIGRFRVLSFQSASLYRQTPKPLPQIARELKVDAVLEGAVLRSGNRVRITANLVQAAPERQLWAESYEFDLRDVLSVQGEFARDVAARIRVKLTPQESARLTTSRRVDPDAHAAYLLGRAYSYKTPTAGWMRAKEQFEKAIAKDPDYAPPYASLAELYARTGRGALQRNPKELRLQSRQWAEKALKLDDTLAETHTALARVAQQEWDWDTAEREYRRAIELNPSYPLARIWYAMYLYAMQRFDEAVAQAKRAQQLDPVSAPVNTWAGAAYFFAGRVEEAVASWQKALELEPTYSDASLVLSRTYVTLGMHEHAITELQKALVLNRREPLILGALAHTYALTGQRPEALKVMAQLNQIEAEEKRAFPTFAMVYAHAGLGNKDAAFSWLEKSYQERRDRMVWLSVDPLLEPLRSDPRFQDLVRRMKLPVRKPAAPR
jgi:TolB-like protein/Tfp pilus assembly protein PilF